MERTWQLLHDSSYIYIYICVCIGFRVQGLLSDYYTGPFLHVLLATGKIIDLPTPLVTDAPRRGSVDFPLK